MGGLFVGTLGAALLYRAPLGLNAVLLTALWALYEAHFAARRSRFDLLVAVALPTLAILPVALSPSAWSRAFALPAAFGWLLFSRAVTECGFARAFADLWPRAARAPAAALSGLGGIERAARHLTGGGTTLRTAVVGFALGTPIMAVFVVLFSFDARFAATVARIARASGHALDVVVLAGLLTSLALVLAFAHSTSPSAAAVAPGPLGAPPYRRAGAVEAGEAPAEDARRLAPSPLAWTIVLAQVAAVFLLYVVVRAKSLIATHAHIRTTRGVTYATELHGGFASLLVAIGLSVGLVLLGQRLLARERSQLDARSARALVAAEVSLLVLAVPTLASCAQKLALYVDAYGATYQRLAVGVIVVAAFPLLAFTVVRCLRPGWSGYGTAVLLTALGALTAAGAFDADATIARVNVQRGLAGKPFDVEYLAGLSARCVVGLAAARPAAGDPALERFAELVAPLAHHWDHTPRGWRGAVVPTRCPAALADVCGP